MNHILMHKNMPVVDLVIDEDSGIIQKIGQIHNPAHLPIGTLLVSGENKGKPERKKLNDWWIGRSIPASRENIQAALQQMNILQTTELLSKCYGLSLSDQYWICPVDSRLDPGLNQGVDSRLKTGLKWADINFFDNPFSEDVGNILFGHEPNDNDVINLMSPDNTSDGWLRKKWIVSDGKRLLMKGGSGPYQQEPLNELIACAIMRRLGISHIPYTLTFHETANEAFNEKLPYSLCETFITPETELIPAWRVIQTLKKDNSDSAFTHLLRCADTLDIPDVVSSIEKMLVLDYIIANTDRHYNNFGFVRNAETLQWYGAAPIYDSGTALWHDTQFVGQAPKSKPFRSTHAEQIKLAKGFSWFNYNTLTDLKDECAEIFSKSALIDDKRRDALVRAIGNRVGEIIDIAQAQNVNRPKPSLGEAMEAAQKKVNKQTSVKNNQKRNHDER